MKVQSMNVKCRLCGWNIVYSELKLRGLATEPRNTQFL